MHKIDTPSAVANMPAPSTVGVPGWFNHGSATSAYTVLSSDWANAVQAELMNVIQGAGLTLDKTKQDQLLTALNKMYLARTTITQATIIYVNASTGLDTNDGRTSGAPFKTLQAAINAVYGKYDWNNQPCTIQLANGTYTGTTTSGWVGQFYGTPYGMQASGLTLQGNTASPSSVIINGVNSNGIAVSLSSMNVNGLTFQTTGTLNTFGAIQGWGLFANISSYLVVTNCRFSNCGINQLEAGNSSVITLGAGNSFTGTTQNAMVCDTGGQIWYPGQSINVTGLQVTSGFCVALNGGLINIPGSTFVGTATGRRYVAAQNGIVNTSGGGPNYLPGNVAGVISTQGQYI